MKNSLIFVLAGVLLLTCLSEGAQINVDPINGDDDTCTPCKTITGAYRNANDTDSTITLASGNYTISQQHNVRAKVLLISTAPEETIISCGGGGFTAFSLNAQAAGSGFSNVTFRDCSQIVYSTSSYSLYNVIVTNNTVISTADADGVLFMTRNRIATVTIVGSVFTNNKGLIGWASQYDISSSKFINHEGYALVATALDGNNGQPHSSIVDSVFENIFGGAYQGQYSTVIFHNCVFRNVYGSETVFYLYTVAEAAIINSVLDSNYVNNSCAVYWGEDSGIYFVNSTITNTTSKTNAGICTFSIRYENLPMVFDDCEVYNNHNQYGGVAYMALGNILAINSTFYNNTATVRGGVFIGHLTDVILQDSEFYGNYAPQVGVVDLDIDSSIFVENVVFHNNSAGEVGVLLIEGHSNITNAKFYNNVASAGPDILVTDVALLWMYNVQFSYCNNYKTAKSISVNANSRVDGYKVILEHFDNSDYAQAIFDVITIRGCSFPLLGNEGCFPETAVPNSVDCLCGEHTCDYKNGTNSATVCSKNINSFESPIVCPIPSPVDPPTVFGVQPLTTPTTGGVVTVLGYNFGNDISKIGVKIGASDCQNPVFVTVRADLPSPAIQCSVGSGTGKDQTVIVTVDGKDSTAGQFSRTAPKIDSYTAQLSSFQISISGSNFGNDKSVVSVNIGNANWVILAVDHTYIITEDILANATMRRRANLMSGVVTVDSQSIKQDFDITGFPSYVASTTGGVTGGGGGSQVPGNKSNKGGIIAAAVIVPVVVVAIIIGIVVYLRSRQRPSSRANRAYRSESFDNGTEMGGGGGAGVL